MTGVLIRQKRGDRRYRDTEGKMEVEIRAAWPRAEEWQELLVATGSQERGLEWTLSQSFQKEPNLLTARV